jgi:hypothetical protein
VLALGTGELLKRHGRDDDGQPQRLAEQVESGAGTCEVGQDARMEPQTRERLAVVARRQPVGGGAGYIGPDVGGEPRAGMALVVREADDVGRDDRHVSGCT